MEIPAARFRVVHRVVASFFIESPPACSVYFSAPGRNRSCESVDDLPCVRIAFAFAWMPQQRMRGTLPAVDAVCDSGFMGPVACFALGHHVVDFRAFRYAKGGPVAPIARKYQGSRGVPNSFRLAPAAETVTLLRQNARYIR